MKAIVAALVAALATATVFTISSNAGLTNTVVQGATVGEAGAEERLVQANAPDPSYILYPEYVGALPYPNCYWMRVPVYDSNNEVIGWRGRPKSVCP
jgi:hypothetical protein